MWLKVLLDDSMTVNDFDDSDFDVFVNENSIKKIIQVDRKMAEGYDDYDVGYEIYDIHYVDGDVDNRVIIGECGKIKQIESVNQYGITMK